MPARIVYPIALLIALLVYVLLPADFYHHPDSSYLHARYARNLIADQGFGANPDERILLTPAALPILAQTLAALPTNQINQPMRVFPLLLMGAGIAALLRLLLRAEIKLPFAMGVCVVWLIGIWQPFGGEGWWLAALCLIASDFAASQRWVLAGLFAGLAMLVNPIVIVFAALLGISPGINSWAKYYLLSFLPSFIWWIFAYIYFGADGLRGLSLYQAKNEFLPYLVILGAIFLFDYPLWLPSLWLPLIILGVIHTLAAMLLDYPVDPALFWLVTLLIGICGLTQQSSANRWRYALKGAFLLIILINLSTLINLSPDESTYPPVSDSVGYYGDHHAAFQLGDTAYELSGAHNPHLRDLIDSGDQVGVMLATVPDMLLVDTLPEDHALDLLGYQPQGNNWQRSVLVYPWQHPQAVDLTFGTDIHLHQVTLDRVLTAPDEIIRVRLDWQLDKAPEMPIYLTLNLLDYQGVGFGGIEQVFPVEKWDTLNATTYHVLPVNTDAPPGLYQIEVVVGYNAAIVDRQRVTSLKIPVESAVFDQPPLVSFGVINLMGADLEQTDNQIILDVAWQAVGNLPDTYTVFVHLTPLDDVTPLAQIDAPPMGGRYPTTIWASGEVIQEQYILDISAVPAGDYVIRVGWYHPQQGRLPTPQGDSFIVAEITH